MKNLIIAEHDNQHLHADTLKVIQAASHTGTANTVLVIGSDCQSVAEQAAKAETVSQVLIVDTPEFGYHFAEMLSPVITNLASDYQGIWFCASSKGKDLAPRVAAKMGVGQLSDIVQVISEDTFVRPIYAGNAFAKVTTRDSTRVITVRGSAFDPVGLNNNAPIEQFQIEAPPATVSMVRFDKTENERPELTAAEIVISGGRGVGSKENFALIEQLADKLGAAIGASRAAVDAGFVANDLQVGQTGKIVAPKLYIAVGISGAIQHLAGMKESKVIVAINKDPDSPIFEVADYGLVGDLFEILPQLTEQL
ncbi:electron transfer flavoprotein subunit beta [Vibrio panuliri]|uniref:Electron transfer flavoprotein subunit alpha n=1 Tax=Vibrio panuliri TaxID=1381081 RepID=A0A1Q9HKQ4_9VIBR|nr:FAD-binding protein [Vibrio panuliri]OLQ90967.1 electron transfer flavoprotein subunit beta [Vibrio panuliri]